MIDVTATVAALEAKKDLLVKQLEPLYLQQADAPDDEKLRAAIFVREQRVQVLINTGTNLKRMAGAIGA